MNQSALVAESIFAGQQSADDADRFVLTISLHHRIDPEHVGVGRQRTRAATEDHPTTRHVIELHDALGHVERVVIWQGNHAGAEPDAVGPLAGSGEEHLRRRDHLPAGGVVFAAPEFIESQLVQTFHEVQIPPELQRGIFPDGMMRCQKCTEFDATHDLKSQGGSKKGEAFSHFRPCSRHSSMIGEDE